MTWYMIESLGPNKDMTVVFKDGVRRDWSSVKSITRETGIDTDNLSLEEVFASGQHADPHIVQGKQGPRKIAFEPKYGASGRVFAVLLWVGLPDAPVGPARKSAVIEWELNAIQVKQGLDSWLMSSDDPDGFQRRRDPGEYLRKVLRFDSVPQLTQTALNPEPETVFETGATVLHDDGHVMAWRSVSRCFEPAEDGIAMRAINHDVTDTEEPQIGPLEVLGLGEPAGNDAPVAFLLTFPAQRPELVVVVDFIHKPPPVWVDYVRDGNHGQIHPDDWPGLRRTQAILVGAPPEARAVTRGRLRAHVPGGWQWVEMTSKRYPGSVGNNLHIVEAVKIEDPFAAN